MISNAGVELSVKDDGPGIPDEHRSRLFEAFFTTKKDVGTGLGLWVVKEIVDRHDGTVRVQTNTNEDHGTTFTVFLPAIAQASSASAQ
ncbi:ATP-binding protein [Candidatus Korobacter versatilis]|uniref:ATP-binding protein n=1 Tax=Candidatus Korobacter versatilis TaxID=658062 RepID=UPI000A018F7C|nr:HAMP domain-containing sensor histidine kinase [Candidatus Koribacter versatilis]